MGTPQSVCRGQLTRFAEEDMPAFSRRTNGEGNAPCRPHCYIAVGTWVRTQLQPGEVRAQCRWWQRESMRHLPLALLHRLQWSIVAPIRETGSVVDQATSHVFKEGISW
jgi:hypothetical protein